MLDSSATRARIRQRLLSQRWTLDSFDRVNVLGDDASYGHSGCVNALSWARNGELLLSAGDDRTVQIWRMDSSVPDQEYPFVCRSVLATHHTANIFNVHMLPYSSNIATVAGDGQVQVHEVETISSSGPPATAQLSSRHTCIHRLRCHEDRVKRLCTEESPHLFLTVSEDGTVRQHDLRTPHDCNSGSCPSPLLKLDFELSTLSLSPLTPFQFVVAGESAYGYLFDRRQLGRFLSAERGMVENGMTHCVRRFGRPPRTVGNPNFRDHVTGSRMSSQNGHEVLLSYGADAVYLYSTLDTPEEEDMTSASKSPPEDESSTLPPKQPNANSSSIEDNDTDQLDSLLDDYSNQSPDRAFARDVYAGVPMILPRQRFAGARNVDTIKDVNFVGPNEQFIASGSDDGNVFLWHRGTGALAGIFEGDSTVVNVIEGHPHLPLFAASGIDTTIKLFGSVSRPRTFSRMDDAERIVASNARRSTGYRVLRRHHFTALLAAMAADEGPQCSHQ